MAVCYAIITEFAKNLCQMGKILISQTDTLIESRLD